MDNKIINKSEKVSKTQIIHNLVEIIEIYSSYRVSQHLSYLMDKKGSYKWSNEELLRQVELYKDKLENEYEDID